MTEIKYTVIYFDAESRESVEAITTECKRIVCRDLGFNLVINYKQMNRPDVLLIDEDNDGVYDLRKTTKSDELLRQWGLEQCKNGTLEGSIIVMNPESRSGVSGVGTMWKKGHDILVVGCFKATAETARNKVMHCFLHEIGHSLGAKHTSNDLDSIMCYGKIETYDYHETSINEIHECKKNHS